MVISFVLTMGPETNRNALGISSSSMVTGNVLQDANNESSEVFDIIKPGRRVKIKGYRQ